MRPSNHLIHCHPLLLQPSIFPSIRVFSNESVLCIRGLKYWGFSFSSSSSNEYSELISFRIDWLDLLAVRGTLKSLLQHHNRANVQYSSVTYLEFPGIRVFSNESVLCIRGGKYWSFSISLSHEYSELISFRIDWLDLLTVRGTLKSLLQYQSSKFIHSSALSFLYSPTLSPLAWKIP